MRYIFVLALILLSGFFSARLVSAKIHINEFSSAGSDDWIELYNDQEEELPLQGYIVRDATDTNKKELDGTIPARGFFIIEWNKLNADVDTIRLLLNDSPIDEISYGNSVLVSPENGQSAGRATDGGDEWNIFSLHSKGLSNGESEIYRAPEPTATKTPTPTKIPTPTKTPRPTKTVMPTSSPTAMILSATISKNVLLTPSPTKNVSPNTDEKNSSDSSVLAVQETSVGTVSESQSGNVEKESPQVLGITNTRAGIAVIIGGILFLSAGGIAAFKKYKYVIFR